MKTIMSLAAAAALAGILITGCSTEADEKTAVTTDNNDRRGGSRDWNRGGKDRGRRTCRKEDLRYDLRISHLSRQTRWQAILRKIWKLRARKYS